MLDLERVEEGVGVDEIGSCLCSFHGECSPVIGQGSLLGSVKCPKPVSLFGCWVSYLSCIPPPWPSPHPEEPTRLGLLPSSSPLTGGGW